MTDQEKIDMGFDVRNVPEKNRNKVDRIESKAIQNPYAKKYMEDKKTLVVKENIVGMLTHVKNKRKLGSTNETIKFLCDLEKDVSKLDMIKEIAKCQDCGAEMSVEHAKKVHQHVDGNVECFGCLQPEHRFSLNKNAIVKLADKIRAKDEQSGQTETSDDDEKEMPRSILVEYTAEQRAML